MGRNAFSRNGKSVQASHPIGSAKAFFVVPSGTAKYNDLSAMFPPDEDGVVRVYTTIDAAIGACTANRGDIIYVAPGHTETVSAAAGIVGDIAGVTILGLGVGNDRPRITFGTSTAASFDISASSVKVKNVVGIAGIDGLTKPFNVTGDDVELDIEWQDASSTVEAATVVRLDTADRSKLKLKYNGFTAGNAAVRVVAVDDCDNVEIDIDGYGVVSTAWVNLVDAASTNVRVTGRLYTQGVTNFSRLVVDTVGGSTWDAEIFDASFGGKVSGGSAAAFASDDVSAVASEIAAIRSELSGAAGITSFPTGAAAANAVSLAEVLRFVQDKSAIETLDRNSANYFSVTADMTQATWNTVASHEIATVTGMVRMRVVAQVTGTLTDAADLATIQLGVEGTTNAWIAATGAAGNGGNTLSAGEVWVDNSPTETNGNTTTLVFDKIVAGGLDVGYEIAGEALTGGAIVFHVWYTPISSDGAVAAGTGAAL